MLVGQVWEEELAYSHRPPILWLVLDVDEGEVRILDLERGEVKVYARWLFSEDTPDSWVRRVT
jgi:hypothetical protein